MGMLTRDQALKSVEGQFTSGISPEMGVNSFQTDFKENTTREEAGSAFRTDNLLFGLAVDETNGVDNTPDPDFDFYGSLRGTEYEQDADYFTDALNEKYMDALKLRFEREKKDRATLDRGGWSAVGWQFLAAMLGPENLIPGTVAVKGTRVGYSVLKSGRNVAGASVASAGIAEFGLHQAQGLRTFEESAFALGASGILGFGIGSGLATLANKGLKTNFARVFDEAANYDAGFKKKLEESGQDPLARQALTKEAIEVVKRKKIDEVTQMAKLSDELKAKLDEPDAIDAKLDELYLDALMVRQRSSVGAAADNVPSLDELTIYGKAARTWSEKTKWLNPNVRLMTQPSKHARALANNIFDNPLMLQMHEYKDSPAAITNLIKNWTEGRLSEVLRKVGTTKNEGIYKDMRAAGIHMKRTEFREQVGRALRRNDGIDKATGEVKPEFNKFIAKAAKVFRDDVYEVARKDLEKLGFDLKSKASSTGESYLNRFWNRKALLRDESVFKAEGGEVWEWAKAALDREIATVSRKFDKQISNLESQIADLKDAKLRRQADLEFRETGEAGRLHRELYDVDSEISRLEAELENLKANEVSPEEVAEQSINDLLKAFGSNMELGENFNSGFLRQMGLDRSQIDDFTDYLMKEGYLRERNGRMQVRKLSDDNEKLALRSPDDPQADHVDKAIYAKLMEDANRILPDEYKFETPETLGGNIGGKVNLDEKLVQVALDAPDIASKLRHESLHALRDRFKPDEWEALRKASKEIEFKNEAAYRGYGVKGDELEEERIANLIEYAYKGGNISKLEPKVLSTLEKIVAWIKALATTLKKPEYNKLQTILDDMESGAIGRRSQGGSKGDDLYSLKDGTLKTDTPAFKKWFGDSKVVDEKGKPLVVYHGTPDARFAKTEGFQTPIEAYQKAIGNDDFIDKERMFFFSDNKRVADTYADDRRAFDYQNAEPETLDTYISIKNPKVIDWGGKVWKGLKPEVLKAKAEGYDGVIVKNVRDTYTGGQISANNYIAFDPTQIKSVNNRGTFDPNDPRILYSLNERTPEEITAKLEKLNAHRDKLIDDIDKIEGGQEVPLSVLPEDIDAILKAAQSGDKAKMPETLTQFLKKSGGLIDESGELAHMGATHKTQPKLVVGVQDLLGNGPRKGMSFDEATLAAWEAGFYRERPSIQELLSDLGDDFNGHNPKVRESEAGELNAYFDRQAIEEELAQLGIDPKNKNFKFDKGPHHNDVVKAAYRALNRQADEQIKRLEAKKLKLEDQRNRVPEQGDIEYKSEIQEIVDSIFDNLVGRNIPDNFDNENIISTKNLKKKPFTIEDNKIEQWLVDDVELVSRSYVRNVAGQIEMRKRFGTLDLKPHLKAIQDDFTLERAKVRADTTLSPKQKQKLLDKLQSQQDDAIEVLRYAREKILGMYPDDLDTSVWARSVDMALRVQYMMALGGVLATSAGDVWRVPATVGFRRTFGKALPQLISGSEGFKVNRDFAKKYAGIAEIIMNNRIGHMIGLRDPLAMNSPAEVFIQKSTETFSKLTGLPYWNQFWKEFVGATTIDHLIGNMVKGLDNISPYDVRVMRSLGLGDISTGASDYVQSGGFRQIGGVWTINPSNLPPEVVRLFSAAVKKQIDTSIVTPSLGDAPLILDNKIGRMGSQFRSFGISSNSRILASGLQGPTQRFWGAATGMVTAGMFIYALKQLEAGREIDDNPATWLVEGIDRSGLFWVFFEANNIFEKLGGPGAYAVAGARQPASRFASRNILSGLVPLLGTTQQVGELANAGLSYANPMTEGDFTKGDVKNLRRVMPYASLPYWRWMIDNHIVPAMQDAVE